MTDDIHGLLSPFRLYDDPTMYQGLPNVQKDDDKVKPTSPPRPSRDEPKKDDGKKDKEQYVPKEKK
jgi:hypothetical protein